ncbi:hypothetical protein RRG08_010891, partial [Elysia crispata]
FPSLEKPPQQRLHEPQESDGFPPQVTKVVTSAVKLNRKAMTPLTNPLSPVRDVAAVLTEVTNYNLQPIGA